MKRIDRLEYIDLGNDFYTLAEYRDCLRQLGRIGQKLGGHRATIQALERLEQPISSILDVGCGGGHLAAALAARYPDAEVVGIDLNQEAIAYAQKHHKAPNLRFEVQEEKSFPYPDNRFDIVSAQLVCHHMNESELRAFIQAAHGVSRTAVVINDLHRHALAYLLFACTAPLMFRNRLIVHDGLISVRRGFTNQDWTRLEQSTALWEASWHRRWNRWFRWTVTIEKPRF